MRPLIYAKSALKEADIDCKMNIGCDGIEIQLLSELVDKEHGGYKNASIAFNLSKFERFPISVVHCPIISGIGDMTLEQMCDMEDIKLLEQTCFIADYFGRSQHKQITVVVHSETYLDFIKGIGSTLDRITSTLYQLLESYPNIRIGIENVSPLRGIGKDQQLHLSNNFKFDNVKLAEYFRKELGTVRIGTVLDTCHATITKKYMDCLYKEVADRKPEDYSMDKYFEMNKDTCFLIHLADIAGSGYGPKRHGIPYTSETADKCNEILGIYSKYGYTCPITLEVEETDFLVSDGYRNTRDVLLGCSNLPK